MKLSKVTQDAMELPRDQRLSLVRTILGATGFRAEPNEEVDRAWEDEIANRIQAIDTGKAKGSDWEDVLKEIDNKLAS